MKPRTAAPPPAKRSRFLGVPLLPVVVIGIPIGGIAAFFLAVFWWIPAVAVPAHVGILDAKNVTLCMANLKSIGTAIQHYHQIHGHYPQTRSGIQFLLAPLRAGVIDLERTPFEKAVHNFYLCPGDDFAMQAVGDVAETYGDLDNLDPCVISYAGRNTIDHPLDRMNAAREAIACDAGGQDGAQVNHRRVINVLFLDGHIEKIDVSTLPGGHAQNFEVGRSSPIPALRTLNKDN